MLIKKVFIIFSILASALNIHTLDTNTVIFIATVPRNIGHEIRKRIVLNRHTSNTPSISHAPQSHTDKAHLAHLLLLDSRSQTNVIAQWTAENKDCTCRLFNALPSPIKENIQRTIHKASNKFTYRVTHYLSGEYLLEMTKAGKVPGSKAVYKKLISAEGKTLSFFKDTFDPSNNLVHRKYKTELLIHPLEKTQ